MSAHQIMDWAHVGRFVPIQMDLFTAVVSKVMIYQDTVVMVSCTILTLLYLKSYFLKLK